MNVRIGKSIQNLLSTIYVMKISLIANIVLFEFSDFNSLQWKLINFSQCPTSAQAPNTASFSMVTALSLYNGDWDFPAFSLAREDTRSWCTLRRSLRSRATPLPIQVLQTWFMTDCENKHKTRFTVKIKVFIDKKQLNLHIYQTQDYRRDS